MKISTMLFSLLLATTTVLAQSDYCSISKQHTMCQYKGAGPACNGQPLARGVTQQEIMQILDVHNRYRSLIARGEEKRGKPGPQPPAANMKQMIWDEELSQIAQRHADQCKFAHDCSDCRKTRRFGVGQNLYIYKQTQTSPANNWDKAVTDWYDEVTLFSKKNVEPFKFSSPTGHYTALVWADTDKVGCGATSYKDGRWFATLYTCNYGPGGNYIAGQMYKQGPPCSDCGKGTNCSKQFPGLCELELSSTSNPLRNATSITDKPINPVKSILKTTKPTKKPIIRTNRPISPKTTRTPRTTTTKKTKPKTFKTTTRKPVTTTIKPTTPNIVTSKINSNTGNELFSCKFNTKEESCKMRNNGKLWNLQQKKGNNYQELELFGKEKAEFFFTQLISPPASKVACLDFRFKKFSAAGFRHILTVLAWPSRGKPGKVSIVEDSPDQFTWVRAQVTFRNVDREFLLMFRAKGPQGGKDSLILAVDDVQVTMGKCKE